jgi:hypothetical protein
MSEILIPETIGKAVLGTRGSLRTLAALPEAVREAEDNQTFVIRRLQAREAELDLIRALEQQYAGLRARLVEFEQRLKKLETAR